MARIGEVPLGVGLWYKGIVHRILIVLLVIGLSFARSPLAYCSPTTFWISPDGSDASKGTRTEPFRTLERARDAVRAVNGKQEAGTDIVVYLNDGTYRLEQPLLLDWRDSGRNGGDVVYRAAPGEHPVISGSIPVRDWSLHDGGSGIYKAHVGQVESRQLYVNGNRATRARTEPYPAGFLPLYFEIFGIPFKGGIAFIPTNLNPAEWRDPSTWTSPRDIEAVIVTQWKMMSVPLDSVIPYPGYTLDPLDPSFKTGLLMLQEPGWPNANVYFDSLTIEPGIWSFWQVTRFENAYEFLNEPGEWYLNEATGWLYYIPRHGEDLATAEVELPILEVLVDGRGEISRPVSSIRFEDLTFSYSTWLGPSGSDGYVSDQSGFHLVGADHAPNIIGHDKNVVRTAGNVRFRFAREITLSGNIFEHLGGVALDFDTGSQGNTIESNLFEDISSAAIELGGVSRIDHHPDRRGQVTRDNVILNNLVRMAGREYVDAAGIFVGFTRRTTISHNTIVDVPWSGIAVGWGWGLLDPGGFPGVPNAQRGEWGVYDKPTPNGQNKILNNRIHAFLGELWDGGAIYTTGHQGTSLDEGLLIEGNVATGKRATAGGNTFYTDGGSRYIELNSNVSVDNPVGVTDFGPPPRAGDPLPYSPIPSAFNGIPYGSDRGGCRTYGDIRFTGNYWLSPSFFNICPYSENGVSYPTNMISRRNNEIRGKADVPRWILRAAGAQERPSSIPPHRWILPPL
ncbi:MAG: right-handed parallel beta-helix repeat-containing protein [Acidobacteriota bacterium]